MTTHLWLLTCIAVVASYDEYAGTNTGKVLIHYGNVHSRAIPFRRSVTTFSYAIPDLPVTFGRTIQGIEVLDLTYSAATARIVQGGLGYNYVDLRLVSDYGLPLNYDVYIYI
ncbi:hypothetical protein EVAR_7083_1 [Eumeta japonica]|uniref:Uncharacterized protein n=1 Tax=Eumeta variegata TaxID=151549 RepID=A0A4C1YBT4_EUMVA|nr:hypothetical protein EVAR_7083_1 [Eumeta japonica]